jgi:hypothetical protein
VLPEKKYESTSNNECISGMHVNFNSPWLPKIPYRYKKTNML